MQRAKRANELVAWVNRILNTNDVRTLDDLKSGVHLVQIIHSIDPDRFDLSRVDFRASNDYYFTRNLKLLQDVMEKLSIPNHFQLEGLMQGEKRNDLFGLVSYLKLHYPALKGRVNSKAALTYDPALQRKRAQEKRNAKHRPFRVAARSTAVTPAVSGVGAEDGDVADGSASTSRLAHSMLTTRSLRAFSDAGTASDTASQAYTTVSTKQNTTRMRMRREELEKLARSAAPELRRMSSIGSHLDRSGAQTPLRPSAAGTTRSPLAPGGGPPLAASTMSSRQPSLYASPGRTATPATAAAAAHAAGESGRWAPVCTAVTFEALDLGGGDLGSPSTWPAPAFMEPDVYDPGCPPPPLERSGSPTKGSTKGAGAASANGGGGGRSPTKPPRGRPAWSSFDAALEAFRREVEKGFPGTEAAFVDAEASA